jgi:hypothetical protein
MAKMTFWQKCLFDKNALLAKMPFWLNAFLAKMTL